MHAQFLVRRGRMHERFGIAAQVQAHARPVADAEHRNVDLVPLRLRAAKRAAVEIICASQNDSVLICQPSGKSCEARPSV